MARKPRKPRIATANTEIGDPSVATRTKKPKHKREIIAKATNTKKCKITKTSTSNKVLKAKLSASIPLKEDIQISNGEFSDNSSTHDTNKVNITELKKIEKGLFRKKFNPKISQEDLPNKVRKVQSKSINNGKKRKERIVLGGDCSSGVHLQKNKRVESKIKLKTNKIEHGKINKDNVNCNNNIALMSESDASEFEDVPSMDNSKAKVYKDNVNCNNNIALMSESNASEFEDVPSMDNSKAKVCQKRKSSSDSKDVCPGVAKRAKKTDRSKGIKKELRKLPKTKISKEKQPRSRKRKSNKDKSKSETTEVSVKADNNYTLGTDECDVTSVLLRMEGVSQLTSKRPMPGAYNSSVDSESEEESDWEEVADHHCPVKSQIPENAVEITLDLPDVLKKRKKKKFDWKAWVERKIRRFQKDVRISMHKVELLCLLAHGTQQNVVCQSQSLFCQAFSLIPNRIMVVNVESIDIDGLKTIVTWFKGLITFHPHSQEKSTGLIKDNILQDHFEKQFAATEKQLVLMFAIVMRAMGFDVRIVMSFQPLSLKQTDKSKSGKPPSLKQCKAKNETLSKEISSSKKLCDFKMTNENNIPSKSDEKTNKIIKCKKKNNRKPTNLLTKNNSQRRSASKVRKDYKERNSDSEDFEQESENSYSEEEMCNKKRKKSKKNTSHTIAKTKSKGKNDDSSDFEEETEYRSPQVERSKKLLKQNKKTVSIDSIDQSGLNTGCDVWVEVYLSEDSKWVCVDCVRSVINKPYDMESSATYPLQYCLAYSNDGSIKDVTARYASNWLSNTRKLRVDSDWWLQTLEVYRNEEERNEQDDENIKDQLIRRPLPTSIAQFKNHPLYVVQRHLLKFEAIYPDSAIPIGYIRGESIYARECVHTLHSRENWMKEGKAVVVGEEPYKMVKSRPKWKKPKENPDALDLDLFGEWQTDIYSPPPAVDGKVPRNEYGNVELFKPWMLPGGTVHVQVPALNRIAKKLGVDCVPAMMGWDYHGGFSHALLDGWVVCIEHKEALMAAWEEDQLIQRQREYEKLEKRVIGNWKLLTRGLLIKEKLKTKFDLQTEIQEDKVKEEDGKSKGETATDVAMSWPRRQQKAKHDKMNDNNDYYKVETM